jgi:hypothetical protein
MRTYDASSSNFANFIHKVALALHWNKLLPTMSDMDPEPVCVGVRLRSTVISCIISSLSLLSQAGALCMHIFTLHPAGIGQEVVNTRVSGATLLT